MRVCIIGGGLIGLFSAYYLTGQGYSVTIVDKGDFTRGASVGNAGMICPSHFIPLAAPGVIRQSMKWMFDNTSPFYIKPRLDKNWIKWCLQFFLASNKKNVGKNTGLLSAFLRYSQLLYAELEQQGLQMDLRREGIIMVCDSSHALAEEVHQAHLAGLLGIQTQILSARDIELLNPGVQVNSIGGVHYVNDMHLTPQTLFDSLKKILSPRDITWKPACEIIDFHTDRNKIIAACGHHSEISAEAFVLAGGAWSTALTQKLNLPILIEGGKGYNITLPDAHPQIKTPMILVEGRVAVTPMGVDLRMGGTMEIAGLDDIIRKSRVKGILSAIEKYLPDYPVAKTEHIIPWSGYRPLSTDGMPVLGKLLGLDNVFINTGHGMLGLSLAPASGRLLEEIITNTMRPT